ncbi:hypothetical protein B0H67DRAFT_638994 [Lasiosphaeris hirsuta]|uniref:Nitrogen regulatory protein areA GATA-like domain-containing protein n=1 Tax=Lasiosphaeris hirsuta TaxID=260670 RepID=A0AA40BA75_9PEZI|nr:hypothetical protein B0H67DRAFT_638994 [Lasiosphaeris hirsuta]
MAVVLSSEENSYFSSSTLRRSHSQPKFVTKRTGFHTSASASRISDIYHEPSPNVFSDSNLSTAPSSPRAVHNGSTDLSCSSTPATNFSLAASDCDEADHLGSVTSEHIVLPQYDDVAYFNHVEDLEPPLSPRTGHSYTSSPNDQDTSATTSRPGSPDVSERAEDDIAIRAQPSRHVDYLSHNWREEDIWSSWKHIVSRRGDYSNAARLENASWRTWMKSKNKLSTVSPETLNWLKDCDVTWLYGPLQTGSANLHPIHTDSNSGRLSKSNSFVKKPILKKRSMSEIMLQRSLSASSLVKQAAAAVQAQQKEGLKRIGRRPGLERAATDYITFPFSSRRISHDNTSLFPSAVSSGFVSPGGGERKHIHFNEQVAQCIAVDIKGDDEDEEADPFAFDSDSDDGAIMMKRTKIKKRRPTLRKPKSHSYSGESKTIAMLPSTTLKYREDTPEPTETAMKHSTTYRSPIMSPSSSQETLRPSKKSGKLFISSDDEDDNEDTEDVNAAWPPPKLGEGGSGLQRSASSNSLATEPAGMRRTESGMFMPLEEGDASSTSEGLFGRVIDTVNTARDIAHVIWNVGWRK